MVVTAVARYIARVDGASIYGHFGQILLTHTQTDRHKSIQFFGTGLVSAFGAKKTGGIS